MINWRIKQFLVISIICLYKFIKNKLNWNSISVKQKMMRSGKSGAPNTVVQDRQWIRRVKQEEINMIDSFSGQRAD